MMTSGTALIHEVASSEITELLHRALRQFDGPQSASKILGKLPKTSRPKPAVADELLQQEVAAGRLWQYPDVRKKPQFWIRSPIEFARVCLIRELQRGAKSEKLVLKSVTKQKTLASVSAESVQQMLGEMLRTGEASIFPPLVGVKQTKASPRIVSFFKPDPADYVKDALQKVSATLGISIEALLKSTVEIVNRELEEMKLEWQTDELGQSTSGLQVHSSQETVPVAISQDERLLEAMRAANPKVDDGDIVRIADLRRELDVHMPGTDFDRAVMDAVHRRILAIHRHDSPNLISTPEQQQLICDEDGNYYDTISRWRN